MDFHNQRPKAAETMQKAAKDGETCINCHKGIAHKLPDMTAGYKAMARQLLAQGQKDAATADRLFALKTKPLFAAADPNGDAAGRLFPATPVRVLARENGLLKVQIEGWQQEQAERVMYQRFGQRVFAAALQPPLIEAVKLGQGKKDPDSDLTWSPATLEAWTTPDALTADEAGLWAYGQEMFVSSCSTCHAKPAPDHYLANQWIGTLKAMSRFISLDKDDYALLQTYLQLNAKDATQHVDGS
jgi:trimethylamine-N-oxide reductase cytochrome c-type subunit TorC